MPEKYNDILILEGDLAESDGTAQIISNCDSVLQDILHSLLESGLFRLLIAERSADGIQSVINQIVLVIEEDLRVIPGTAEVIKVIGRTGEYLIKAETYEFGTLNTAMKAGKAS